MLCQGVGASRQPSRCEEDYEDGPARWPQARMREAVSASPTLCGSVVSSLHVRARRAKEEILRAARTKTSSLCAGDERTSSILIQHVNARVICSSTTSSEGSRSTFRQSNLSIACSPGSRLQSTCTRRASVNGLTARIRVRVGILQAGAPQVSASLSILRTGDEGVSSNMVTQIQRAFRIRATIRN